MHQQTLAALSADLRAKKISSRGVNPALFTAH